MADGSVSKVSKRSRKSKAIVSPTMNVTPTARPTRRRGKARELVSPVASLPPASSPSIADGNADATMVSKPNVQPVSDLILSIRELYRQRDDLLRAEGNLARQLKSIAKRAKSQVGAQKSLATLSDSILSPEDESRSGIGIQFSHAPSSALSGGVSGQCVIDTHLRHAANSAAPHLKASYDLLHAQRLQIEKVFTAQTKKLPVWDSFGAPIRGFGPVMLGQIVGVAGDLSLYANPAKLWKRFGLGLVGGERQRKHKDAELAEAHGYSPRRRAVMSVIGKMMLMNHKAEYRELYLAHKATQREKHPDLSDGHIDNRAHRYVQKRLLLNLWKAWRGHRDYDTQGRFVAPCSSEVAA